MFTWSFDRVRVSYTLKTEIVFCLDIIAWEHLLSRLRVNLLFSSMLFLAGIYTACIVDIRVIDITRIKYYV